MRILKDRNGVSVIFVVLAILIIVFGALIFVPKLMSGRESVGKDADVRHEQTAYDSAVMKFSSTGAFKAIYDYKNKKFVTGVNGKKVEAYGESEEHQGMVIYVTANKDGKITVKWDVPKEVPKAIN